MASKDLQILQTRTIRTGEACPPALPMSNNHSAGVLLGAVRRQWLPLLLAATVSGTMAYICSTVYSQKSVTAHLILTPQALPTTKQNVYTPPNPNIAATLLTLPQVLQPVGDRNAIPLLEDFNRLMKVKANFNTSLISVDLTLKDPEKAIAVLNDIGAEFVKAVGQRRQEILSEHSASITELLRNSLHDLELATAKLAKEQNTLAARDDNNGHKAAEFQALIVLKTQLESSLEFSLRQQTRTQRSQRFVAEEIAQQRSLIRKELLAARRQQAEELGRGLTNAARISVVREDILQQLSDLEAEMDSSSIRTVAATTVLSGTDADSPGVSSSSNQLPAQEVSPTADSDAIQPAGFTTGSSDVRHPGQNASAIDLADFEKEQLQTWLDELSSVGHEALGPFEPGVLESFVRRETRLGETWKEAQRLQFELDDSRADVKHFSEKLENLENSISVARGTETLVTTAALQELELDVRQKEDRYTQLLEQLDQINQIKNCQLSEYVVTSAASFDPMTDVKSDRKMLFAMTFLAAGLLLSSPSVLFELLRMRPTPVNVVSRRWNLPILGAFSGSTMKCNQRCLESATNQELRLMALRIQQSLFRPAGRVVLFSGLDHHDSPMSLIRSLALCFSKREETVLLVQTQPCQQGKQLKKPGADDIRNAGRPGVAEYLTGEFPNASELVVGTGIAGIDFLPGGCAVSASEAMASSRLTTLIEQFRESYSLIILCGPSTLHPADLQMLAARADGIVFTVTRKSVQNVYGDEVIGDLIELGAPILGFVEQPSSLEKQAFPGAPDQATENLVAATVIA